MIETIHLENVLWVTVGMPVTRHAIVIHIPSDN